MVTRDEAFQQYEEEIAKIDKESREATLKARETLKEQLRVIRDSLPSQ